MPHKLRYLVRRFALMIVSILAVLTIVFAIFRVMPGNPASILVSPRFSEAQRQALLESYGLTEPLYVQYVQYLNNIAHGNLGVSFQTGRPVLPFILRKTINTLAITLPAVILAFTFGPLIGANFAWHRNEPLDRYGTGLVLIMYAAPIFWTGMLAIMVFGFWFDWLPVGGMHSPLYPPGDSFTHRFLNWDFVRHAILPIAIFTLWRLSQPTLIIRNNMIDLLGTPFIKLKRAEGLSERRIKYHHTARNALLPLMHYTALALAFAFGGSVILETVFSWPGIGQAMWNAVLARDYPVAQAAFIMISMIIILMNFVADILSVYIDPRVSEKGVQL